MAVKKDVKKTVVEKKPRYWLYLGLAVFILAGLGAGIGTFDTKYFWDSVYGIIDWLCASIPYFFYGALVGAVIDLYISKTKDHKALPEWFYYTAIFIVLSIVLLWILISAKTMGDILFCLYFPFHYGVFFPGVSYVLIPFEILPGTVFMKLTLDIIFLGVFFSWLNLRLKSIQGKASEKQKCTDKLLLRIIFIVLLIGMIKTASMLI